jgi:hypothetical protein
MSKLATAILFAVMGVVFSLACIGEKELDSKWLYAVVAGVMFALLLASDRMIGG